MLKYLTHKLRTQSINDENHVNEKIDGHDSGTESDGDLEQEDDLIQEHEMELSLSSRQDTVSPTDTACSSESPAFLGPSSSHLLLYDQNSSEEELEVINGGAGDVGSCAIEVGSVSGVPSRLSGGIAGILPIMNPRVDDDDEEDEEEEEEEEDEEEEDDATEDIVEDDVDEDRDYASPGTATTPTAMGSTAATIIESVTGGGSGVGGGGPGAMDTSSSTPTSNSSSSIVRGQFMVIGGACDSNGTEPLDDFAEELSSLTAVPNVPPTPSSATKLISTGAGKRLSNVSSLLEKRKRSLAHNSDDEVRYLLEQQQQQPMQQQQQTLHPLSHQYHHHHSLRQQHHHHHQEQQLHHHHQDELQPEETTLSAPVNFRTSPPLEALKPHRGHILQRSTTPLVLSEGCGAPTGTSGLLPSAGSSLLSSAASSLSSLSGTGISGFYGPGSSSSNNNNNNSSNGVNGGGGGVGGAGGLRFGLVRRTIGCDSPLTAVCHRNSTNPPPHGGGASSLGSGLSTTTRTSSSSTPSSLSSAPASLVRLGAGTGSSPEPSGAPTLVTNMDISRSVSPPAKMFHCAVSPRRRQSRHQQQRLQRPHRPCLDFDKMQQLKARSVTTWRHSNEHSGELSVFCW